MPQSYRKSNWKLHLSTVCRALPLYIAFDEVSYKRCLPLYCEDCLALPQTFPMACKNFLEGDFTVKHTTSSESGVPLDQSLEKEYNKSAKSFSRTIAYTRGKESVLKWNIIHHEKGQVTDFLCNIWVKVCKNGPRKICGRQSLKNLK